ncbi:MAG TPA: hypothetical protein PK395_01725 [bacterium]|nr:hypothetical protein [bacterium]HQP99051.1 hypothetical protein [bacterium]
MFQKNIPAWAMLVIGLLWNPAQSAEIGSTRNQDRLWEPIPDEVFLQEVGRIVQTDSPALAVAVYRERVYAGFENGLRLLEGESLSPVGEIREPVRRLEALANSLWTITDQGLHRLDSNGWKSIGEGGYRDLCVHSGELIVAGERALYRVDGDELVPLENAENCPMAIQSIESYGGAIHVLGAGRLAIFDGHKYEFEEVVDWGEMPSPETRDLCTMGSRLYVATARGLGVLRGMAMTQIRGKDGLCVEDTTCLTASDKDLWVGTSRGAIRMTATGEFQYFAADRWLPSNSVHAIACGENCVYIATYGGLGIIEYVSYTLQKKAAFYERHLEEWGMKRLGFVHKLLYEEDKGGWVREISDNDGGWTAHYLAAMSYKYAVTRDEEAKKEAINSFHAMKWLEEITPIDGYPARAVWAKGEKGHQAQHGSGGFPAEWHDTPDGVWEWKSDTSSDEIDAHFYSVSVFHDVAAEGKEKERAKEHLARMASHIIDNGWVLMDLDGKPTMWGRWDPEYLQRPKGFNARGLNGLEALSFMCTAYAITGNEKFLKAYQELQKLGYPKEVIRQKLVFPPDSIFHSDDELAFYVYFPILHYETNPLLLSIYRRSIERSWEVERIEQNPWFNMIYGVVTGNDCELEQATQHLREWPLDLVEYTYRNSNRDDLFTPKGYVAYSGGVKAISPRERGPLRWAAPSLQLDGGSGGRSVEDPSGWIHAYWMGRYYGMITAPTVTDPALLTVERRNVQLGATPYSGPPRPDLK